MLKPKNRAAQQIRRARETYLEKAQGVLRRAKGDTYEFTPMEGSLLSSAEHNIRQAITRLAALERALKEEVS